MSSRNILREMPIFIEAKQRVIYESIVIAVDIMEINLENISIIAKNRTIENPDGPEFTSQERSLIISLAWGIVDQADLLRRLIQAEGARINIQSSRDFLSIAEVARQLRNFMDHLPQRLAGFLESKGSFPPAHGALSFTYVDVLDVGSKENGFIVNKYRTIVILSSAMQRSLEVSGEPYTYKKFEVPVDHFVLQSFGKNLSLVDVVRIAGKFCDEFSIEVSRFCDVQAQKICSESGCSLEEAMKVSDLLAGVLVRTAVLNTDELQ